MASRNSLVVALLGALLIGAPPIFSETRPRLHLADPAVKGTAFEWFRLTETEEDIRKRLGAPHMATPFGADFNSWQYQIGEVDSHDHSHVFVFRRSTRVLVSVTRSYEPERAVDKFFPAAGAVTVHHYPNPEKPEYSVRLRRLSGGRLLMAMGTSRAGQPTGQLVLMHRSAIRAFYPWLDDQLVRLESR